MSRVDGAAEATQELVRSVSAVDRTSLEWVAASRHGAVVAVALAAGLAWGSYESATAAAFGALLVGLYDLRGPYRARAEALVVATVVLAAVSSLAVAVEPVRLAAAALVVVASFAGGLFVSVGRWSSLAGLHSLVMVLFFTGITNTDSPVDVGIAVLAGGALQSVVSLLGWTRRPYGPEQRALERAWTAIADLGASPDTAHDRVCVAARADAAAVLAQSSATGSRGQRLRGLLDQADWARLQLTALSRRPEPAADRLRQEAAAAVDGLAAALRGPQQHRAERARRALAEFRRTTDTDDSLPPTRLAAWDASLAETAALMDPSRTVTGPPLRQRRAPREVVATLRDAARPGSPEFRHATRLTVAVGLSLVISQAIGLERGYWTAMAAAFVLRPDYTSTVSRGIARAVGTVLGVALMGGLVVALDPPQGWFVVLAGIISVVTYATLAANYAIASGAFSALLVCLVAIGGADLEPVLVARVVDTALGSALALAVYLMWPTWQRTELGPLTAELVRSAQAWTAVVLDGLVDPTSYDPRRARAKATAFRRLRGAVDAALLAVRTEPGRPSADPRVAHAVAVTVVRLVRAVQALEVVAHDAREPRPWAAAPARAVDEALAVSAARLTSDGLDDDEPNLAPYLAASQPLGPAISPHDPVPRELLRIVESAQTLLDTTRTP